MLRKMLQCCTETLGTVAMLFHSLLDIFVTVPASISFESSFYNPSTYSTWILMKPSLCHRGLRTNFTTIFWLRARNGDRSVKSVIS